MSAKAPKSPPKPPGPTMVALGLVGDERLLSEFAYAVDHWVLSMTPAGRARALEYLKSKVTKAEQRHPNGAPMWAPDGMLLDDKGNRSIFDDVDD